ncbi:MAG: hypothetical protein KBT06_00915 [Prevotellaceae bacterium]|nr:hypothetical protein [Candidatus Colivivens equi]
MKNYSEDSNINKSIAITATLLVIVVCSVIGFIIYIKGVHSSRNAHIKEMAKEIAIQDSLNRIEAEKIQRQYEIAEQEAKAQSTEDDDLGSYVDKMIDEEIRVLDGEGDEVIEEDEEINDNVNDDINDNTNKNNGANESIDANDNTNEENEFFN